MATYNREFRDRFLRFMEERGLNPNSAAKASEFVVSKTTLQNWRDGQVPTRDNLLRFLSFFPEENAEEWLSIIGQNAA